MPAQICNCENSRCEHPHGCRNQTGGKRHVMYVGAVCKECFDRMPPEYRLPSAESVTDEQIVELRDVLHNHREFGISREIQNVLLSCQIALEYEALCWTRDARAMVARGICAEAIRMERWSS